MVMDAREFRVVVVPADFEATVSFYERILELRRVRAWDEDDGRGVVLAAGGNAVVEILEAPEGGPAEIPAHRGTSLALEVGDVDAWYERVLEAGGAVQGRPQNTPWGHRVFSMRDPDGMTVALYEVVAVSQRA